MPTRRKGDRTGAPAAGSKKASAGQADLARGRFRSDVCGHFPLSSLGLSSLGLSSLGLSSLGFSSLGGSLSSFGGALSPLGGSLAPAGGGPLPEPVGAAV